MKFRQFHWCWAPLVCLLLTAAVPRPVRAVEHTVEAVADKETTGEKEPGLLDPSLNTAIWVLAIFIVLLMVLYPTAWRQVLLGLKKREQRIRGDIAQAEAARLKAEASLKDYNARLSVAEERARELISQAATDGERLAGQIRARAQQESEEMRERALREIETARTQAIAEIYQQAATLATSVAEKILRRNLNADDQRDLVNQSLEQIQSVGKA